MQTVLLVSNAVMALVFILLTVWRLNSFLAHRRAIEEQLSIDQPAGILAEFLRLCATLGSAHDAKHAILECLGEVLWQAQRNAAAPDEAQYLACLRRRGAH